MERSLVVYLMSLMKTTLKSIEMILLTLLRLR
nr:MAG TPA: hypothetical protein [Caudoviricetes sp.]